MNKTLFTEITNWQNQTFPKSTSLSKIKHLKKEVKELEKDIKSNSENKLFEYADCFFLLFGAAYSDGFTYDEILKGIEKKLVINKKRKWGTPDKDGVVNHIK